MLAAFSFHLRVPPILWGTAKSSAVPFTIIALADFILRTITWQHVATSRIWNLLSLSGLVRDSHFLSWLLHCIWHLKELVLDWVWSPLLIVQQRFDCGILWALFLKCYFSVCSNLQKRFRTQTFKLLVYYFYFLFLFECVSASDCVWGPCPLGLCGTLWAVWAPASAAQEEHLMGAGSPQVQASMAQEQDFHGSNNYM